MIITKLQSLNCLHLRYSPVRVTVIISDLLQKKDIPCLHLKYSPVTVILSDLLQKRDIPCLLLRYSLVTVIIRDLLQGHSAFHSLCQVCVICIVESVTECVFSTHAMTGPDC